MPRPQTPSPLAIEEHGPLIRGAGAYVGDIDAPGRAWARIVRSPVGHGRIVGIDVSAAMAADGAIAVLTADDLTTVPSIPIRIVETPEMAGRRQPVIARDRVRYVGEPVAIVVAEDAYLAEDIAELVEVDIEPLPASVDATDASAVDLWDDGRTNVLSTHASRHGDVEAAFAAADLVVERRLKVHRQTGLPLETRGVTAVWEGDHLTLWGPTKYLHATRRIVADFLGIPAEDVVCRRVDVGGMFGVRGEFYPEDFLVPWAARKVGRPVTWIEDRNEHLFSINHSREQHHHYRLALAADGRLLAFTDDVTLDQGAYPRTVGGQLPLMTERFLPGPYRWQAYDAQTTLVATNKTPAGTMRAPAAFEAAFVRERMLDIAAAELGLDPLELRRQNLLDEDELPWTFEHDDGGALTYDTGDYHHVLETVLDRVGYEDLRADVERRREQGELVGLGLALFLESSGGKSPESVGLSLDEDGRFLLGSSAAEIGQSVATMLRKVVTRELGFELDGLDVAVASTEAHDGGTGTYGARTTIFVGSSAVDATRQLVAEARERAAGQLGVSPDDIAIRPDGLVAGDDRLYWKDVAPIEVVGRHEVMSTTYGFGLHLAVVGVDPATGGLDVERLVVAYDTGVAIDMRNVEAQLAGASIQALGGAVLEELPYSDDGQPTTTTLMDYLIPTAAESPRVEVHVFETAPAPDNPLGAKGAGEAGMVGVPAALANAIAAAVGADGQALLSLPLKPANVLDAMGVVRWGATTGTASDGSGDG